MPDALSDELIELRDRTAALAAGPLADLRDRADLDPRQLRSAVAEASAAAGIRHLVGGTGEDPPGSALTLAVVRETLAANDVSHLPGLFAPGPGLLANVDEPLRSRYLLPLLAGDKQGAFGFTEPDGAERHTWAAEPTGADGNLVINGQKSYVTGGADADFINTLVQVDGVGPAMVVIDTDLPGVTMTRRFESLDGSHHAAFEFRDVEVSKANVVGPAGKGMSRAVEQVNGVRMAMAATCVGLMLYVADLVEGYLAAPGRKGSPLGDAERHRLRFGQLRIETYTARSVLYRTARLIDADSDSAADAGGAADGKATINEIMMAKHVTTEAVGRVVDTAIQTVGGQALVEGHPLASIHRRVRALRLAEGPSDVLALNIARGRLELDRGRL